MTALKHFSLPRLALIVLMGSIALNGAPLQAGGVVEGVLALSKSKRGTAAALRYSTIKGASPTPPALGVVWIKGDFKKGGAPKDAELAQKGFQFEKSVIAVQLGTKVSFPNHDDDYHSVFSYSKTKEFDLGRYRKTENAPSVTFDKAGEVKIYCEIHEHMRASVLVLDTPHFTVTDEKGGFRLEGVPAGKHVLKYKLGRKTYDKQIEIKDGASVKLDLGK